MFRTSTSGQAAPDADADSVSVPDTAAAIDNARVADATVAALSAGIKDISLSRANQPVGDGFDTNKLDDREFLGDHLDEDTAGVQGLETIDLLGETVRLFRQTRRLLSKVLVNTATPINQQAQVVATLGTLLKTLSQQQTDLYDAERLKRLEAVVIRLVRDLAPELQDRFVAEYEREVQLIIRGLA